MRWIPRSTMLLATGALLGTAPAAAQSGDPADSLLTACARAAGAGQEADAKRLAEEAETLFRQAQQARRSDPAPLVGRARVISQCRIRFAGGLGAARLVGQSNALLERALELDPTHWSARFTLALNHYHTPEFLGRTDDAIRHFETLLAQQNDRADSSHLAGPYLYLGDLYLREGRRADAVALWRRGAALFPEHRGLAERLARAAAAGEADTSAPSYALEGVTVRARRASPQSAIGGVSLDRLEVLTTPGGAADVLQGVRMQGGVTLANDGSDLFVRGGEPSETPVWVDGGRIFYPGTFETLHGGLFGALNPAVVREAVFHGGGFSVRYGNALSGVLDVRTEGRPASGRARGGLSLSGASAFLGAPLGPTAGAWLTGRAVDATVLTWMQGVSDQFTRSPRSLEGTAGVVVTPGRGLELKATGLAQGDGATRLIESHGHSGPFRSRGGTLHGVLSARIARSGGATAQLAISGSERRSEFRFGVLDREAVDRALSFDLSGGTPVGRRLTVRGGAEAVSYGARERGWMPKAGVVSQGAARRRVDQTAAARHLGAHLEAEVTPVDGLAVVAGARVDRLPGEEEWTTDPRLSLAYRVAGWTLRVGGGVFQQGRWRVGYRIPDAGSPEGLPRRARHVAAGVERGSDGAVRVEGYVKEYDRYAREGIGPQVVEGRVLGADARVRWSADRSLTGWVAYSWLHGRVRLEDGTTVPSRVDVTHGATAVGRWALDDEWELGATARFATGRPHTPVVGAVQADGPGVGGPVYGPVHGERLPTYARLDARLTRVGELSGRRAVTYLEVLNALDRRNVMGYSYDSSYRERRSIESFFARRVAVLGAEVQLR